MAAESHAGMLAAAATELLAQSAGSGESLAVAVVDDLARNADDPVVGRVIERAAIPRRFDEGVLAVLAGEDAASVASADGSGLLSAIVDLPFTQPHPAGGYRYHDLTRDALLQRWREPERRAELRHISEMLANEYEQRFRDADALTHEVAIAAETLQAANPLRYTAIRRRVNEAQLLGFKEAAYHWRNTAGDQLHQFLVRHSSRFPASPHLATIALTQVRRALAEAIEQPNEDVDNDVEIAWLKYWQLHLILVTNSGASPDAAARFDELLAEVEPDVAKPDMHLLRTWLLAAYCWYLIDNDRVEAAAAICDKELALLGDGESDKWNRPGAYLRMAEIQRRLGDGAAAIQAFQHATTAAREVGDDQLALMSLLKECELHMARGDVAAARRAMNEAVHVTWTLPGRLLAEGRLTSDSVDAFQSIASFLLPVLAADDIRLVDDLVEYGAALVPRGERTVNPLLLRLIQAQLFARRGALDRSAEVLKQTDAEAHADGEPWGVHLAASHDRVSARLAQYLGQHNEAEARRLRYLDAYAAPDGQPTNALAFVQYDRAENLVAVGRYEDALAAAQAALVAWTATGDRPYASSAQAMRACALLGLGRVEEGRALIESVRADLETNPTEVSDAYFDAVARAAAADEDWSGVGAAQARRAQLARARGELLWGLAAETQAMQAYTRGGIWPEAASSSGRVADDLSTVHATVRVTSAPRRTSDGLATAVQLFFDGAGDRSHDLRRARDALAEALDEDKDNTWLHVAMFYVRCEQGSWREAGQTLRRLHELQPAWLDKKWFEDRAAEIEQAGGGTFDPQSLDAEGSSGGIVRALVGWLGRTTEREGDQSSSADEGASSHPS